MGLLSTLELTGADILDATESKGRQRTQVISIVIEGRGGD
jgi:hypothetical protein